MVMAQAVKQPVEEQELEFALDRMPPLPGLAPSARDRHGYVPQVHSFDGLLAREGKDVGGSVLPTELVIQPRHLTITDETDGKSRRRVVRDLVDQPLQPGAQTARTGFPIAIRVVDLHPPERSLAR